MISAIQSCQNNKNVINNYKKNNAPHFGSKFSYTFDSTIERHIKDARLYKTLVKCLKKTAKQLAKDGKDAITNFHIDAAEFNKGESPSVWISGGLNTQYKGKTAELRGAIFDLSDNGHKLDNEPLLNIQQNAASICYGVFKA